ncbi:MAG: hypothetical protein ACYCPF_01020 [Streptosporangiaceae bacterium]
MPEVAGGGGVGDFFAALGDGWRLTDAQLARLVPSIAAALDAGWEPHQLARFVGANRDGIRSPYAVLAARLSLAELPPPRDKRTTLPAWCRPCDQRTRMIDFGGDSPRPCPVCKPPANPA